MGTKIKESIPLLAVIVIIFGLARQFIYYNHFNVPIIYFFGLSEIATSVSEDLIYLVPIMLLAIGILGTIFAAPNNSNTGDGKPLEKKSKILLIIILLIILLLVIVGFINSKNDYASKIFFAGLVILLISVILFIINLEKISTYISDDILGLGYLSFIFLMLLGGITAFQTEVVESGKYKGTIIKSNDSTYISTDVNYFIGKTEKFVFIYNANDTTSLILPTESIKSMQIKIND